MGEVKRLVGAHETAGILRLKYLHAEKCLRIFHKPEGNSERQIIKFLTLIYITINQHIHTSP